MVGYDHEPIFACGSMLGIGDAPDLLTVLDEAEVQGLDVMTTGVSLAWATEALQRGLITTKETDGLALTFGDGAGYVQAMQRIVSQPTDFYKALAHGAQYASSVYGGADFALTFGGNEMPGYHTGPAAHLGYLTGARHSHLDSAGYSLDEAAARQGKTLAPEEIASSLLKEERWRQVLTSLVICLFARGIYTQDTVLKALPMAGFAWSADNLARLGEETLRRKNDFKTRAGFDVTKLRIPKRILETPAPLAIPGEDYMRQALESFHQQIAGSSQQATETHQ
jgi:aldehyde:ferredoxin oxidoreductase